MPIRAKENRDRNCHGLDIKINETFASMSINRGRHTIFVCGYYSVYKHQNYLAFFLFVETRISAIEGDVNIFMTRPEFM